ncbi:MAG: hypothetical protein ISS28_01435 [Candidatus Cloacimonetes bacterium]|nr:hypothetical protein [Candidatus Cloacimonadota bacterium]MBL7085749.1 hypothetical protein [Candidatus Cloacimonadota bacterium]
MKAYEFQTRVTRDGKLEIPDTLFKKLLRAQMVRLIVLISEPADVHHSEQSWARLTAKQFLAGYNDSDAIYDQVN